MSVTECHSLNVPQHCRCWSSYHAVNAVDNLNHGLGFPINLWQWTQQSLSHADVHGLAKFFKRCKGSLGLLVLLPATVVCHGQFCTRSIEARPKRPKATNWTQKRPLATLVAMIYAQADRLLGIIVFHLLVLQICLSLHEYLVV